MKEFLAKVAATEPARIRGVIAAIVSLLAALGIAVSAELSGSIEAFLIASVAIIPLLTGESIRKHVTPVDTKGPEGYDTDFLTEADEWSDEV